MRDPAPLPELAVSTHARLLKVSGHDPWVWYAVSDPLPGAAWELDGALLIERRHRWMERRHGLVALGPPAALEALLRRAADAGVPQWLGVRSLSVPDHLSGAAARAVALEQGTRWAWLWTTTSPPVHPLASTVVALDDRRDAAQIAALSGRHSPTAEGDPGTGRSERWVGVRREGRLVAAGAVQRPDAGVAHLAGIVVEASQRGRGLGTAVTSALTRAAVLEEGACTLGVYADNTVGLALYQQLGYRIGHTWHSRPLRSDIRAG